MSRRFDVPTLFRRRGRKRLNKCLINGTKNSEYLTLTYPLQGDRTRHWGRVGFVEVESIISQACEIVPQAEEIADSYESLNYSCRLCRQRSPCSVQFTAVVSAERIKD